MLQTTIRHPAHSRSPRLFFAIYPDREVRRQLVAIQAAFELTTERPVPEENLHLTLAFIGQISMKQYACYARAAATLSSPGFSLTLDRVGHFDKVSLCWFSPSRPSGELLALQRRLKSALASCGHRDQRRFRPHVTLFRKARQLSYPGLPPAIEWRVDRFFLMESVPTENGGVRYLPLEEYRNDCA